MRLLLVILCSLIVLGCASSHSTTAPATTRAAKAPDAQPAADPTATLPIEQLAGELVMTKLAGPTASSDELAAIRSLQLGGVILFGWNVQDAKQLASLVRSLDAARAPAARRAGLPPGVLVSVDQEGGAIRNVPFAPPEHTQPELFAGPHEYARSEAQATGAALRASGVSMDLGPVADLAQEPNHTMAGRAFGGPASDVSPSIGPWVAAMVEGLQSGGVAAATKHFPGFGAATANSDDAVAHVARSRAQLDTDELPPFRAAIKAGTAAVMVSHGIYDQLGATMPAVLEPRIVTRILRDQLGFEGVAMTDSMNAKGFRDAWGDTVPRACPRAVAAGIDLVLLTGSLETARLCRQRIIAAVRDGSLPEQRVREAAQRIEVLRTRWARGPRS